MRTPGLNHIYEMAKKDENIIFIGSDLGHGVLSNFKNELPNQFFMEGISEANIIGMAAGLAMQGFNVYINTIASFLTRRCYEQIAIDLCLEQRKVRLFANGGGLIYGPMGPTHTIVEDIAIMSALPNMAIISPCDDYQMLLLLEQTKDIEQPLYIRVARDNYPNLTSGLSINFGKPLVLKEGNDLAILSYGFMTHAACAIRDMFQEINISVKIIDVHTISPLDKEALIDQIKGFKKIAVLEEHIKTGGLYSIILELINENNIDTRVKSISLPHEYLEIYGEQHQILEKIGLSNVDIFETLKSFLGL